MSALKASTRTLPRVVAPLLLALMAAVAGALPAAAQATGPRPAQGAGPKGRPTLQQARAFVEAAEKRLTDLYINESRANWVLSTFITQDTEAMAAQAQEASIAAAMELAVGATRFDGLRLPDDVARKLKLLKVGITIPAPKAPAERQELTRITTSMEGDYGRGRYCRGEAQDDCLDINQLSNILATSRNPEELLDVWRGWRTIAPPLRPRYERFVVLANKGARDLGFANLGELWRSGYDMTPPQLAAELERLWQQVRPLYVSLHAHVRAALSKKYGREIAPPEGLIPAHLLGNMWSQSWGNIYPLVAPPGGGAGYNLTRELRDRDVDETGMVRFGERFFTSLGFEPLPETFWKRSLLKKPLDHEVVCHASAWDLDMRDDLRIKMCTEITEEDFATVHHELGHNFYQRAYKEQPFLFRGSAHDGFHEAIGDVMALSITPGYLHQIELLDRVPEGGDELGFLMKMALERVAFLPFGLLVDQWRWRVFSGDVKPADYNKAWWELREKYQGIRAPVERTEADFDPGAKYHVPANTPYTRYFLAHILQFQIHRGLCRAAGFEGPLHECSIYGNRTAGERLQKMLAMGASRPWPEALEVLTGERRMDGEALLEYFAPLKAWLDGQNRGRSVGF